MVAPTPGNVSVSLEYIANLDLYKTEKPYNVLCKPSEHVPTGQESNIQTQWHDDVRIEDVRSYMDHLSFREEGFRYLVHDTKLGTRFDGQDVLDDLEEMTEALRKELGAEKALCYDMRVRSKVASRNCEQASQDRSGAVKPVTIAHTDHTKCGGLRRIARHLSEEERKTFLSGTYRCRIFNIWKPLIDVIEDNPLALCDPRSVSPDDLLEVDRVTEEWAGEIYYIKHNPRQKWRYLSNQKKNEVCVFLSFDSNMKDQLTFCPHTSFINPLASETVVPRRSVEIRVITFNKIGEDTGALVE